MLRGGAGIGVGARVSCGCQVMWTYVVTRAGQTAVVIVVTSMAIFALVRLLPGDPALVYAGTNASADEIARIRADMGLGRPLPAQYVIWARHAFVGDFGRSFQNDYPVGMLLRQRMPATIELTVAALVLSIGICLPAGVGAAMGSGSLADYVVSTLTGLGLATPTFWFGIILILIFAINLQWMPASGYSAPLRDPVLFLRHLVLPAVTLSLPVACALTRFTRSAILEVLARDYVRTAHGKGLPVRAVLTRHVLRNGLITVGTVVGLYLGGLLGGVVVIESVFAWPGIGSLLLDAMLNRDYAVVQGGLLLLVAVFSVVNLLTDLMYCSLDPRVRLGAGRHA
jgi:peptide/nickel transport system permease protein